MLGRVCRSDGFFSPFRSRYVTVPGHCVLPIPPNIRMEQVASPFVDSMTANFLLSYAQKQHYRSVAVTGGFTPLGKVLLRLAPRFNIKVLSIVRLSIQADSLTALGSPCALITGDPGFDQLFGQTCRELGCTLLFDQIGGPLTGRLIKQMPIGSTAVGLCVFLKFSRLF